MKKTHGYAPVNGLEMYYEVEGTGDPLVFVPPAFGFAGMKSFPLLAGAARSSRSTSKAMVAPATYRIVPCRSSSTPRTSSRCSSISVS